MTIHILTIQENVGNPLRATPNVEILTLFEDLNFFRMMTRLCSPTSESGH